MSNVGDRCRRDRRLLHGRHLDFRQSQAEIERGGSQGQTAVAENLR